mmetsp:Transcript_31516/g.94042  ORF Transcript_31516/g.94042 Transcript_31516/m.94042 type:complete len:202 (+) Transcript_31516:1070-1675(+)
MDGGQLARRGAASPAARSKRCNTKLTRAQDALALRAHSRAICALPRRQGAVYEAVCPMAADARRLAAFGRQEQNTAAGAGVGGASPPPPQLNLRGGSLHVRGWARHGGYLSPAQAVRRGGVPAKIVRRGRTGSHRGRVAPARPRGARGGGAGHRLVCGISEVEACPPTRPAFLQLCRVEAGDEQAARIPLRLYQVGGRGTL